MTPEDVQERETLGGRVWALGDVASTGERHRPKSQNADESKTDAFVAATGAPKAARPGMAQAKIVAQNVFDSLRAQRENRAVGPLTVSDELPPCQDPRTRKLTKRSTGHRSITLILRLFI